MSPGLGPLFGHFTDSFDEQDQLAQRTKTELRSNVTRNLRPRYNSCRQSIRDLSLPTHEWTRTVQTTPPTSVSPKLHFLTQGVRIEYENEL